MKLWIYWMKLDWRQTSWKCLRPSCLRCGYCSEKPMTISQSTQNIVGGILKNEDIINTLANACTGQNPPIEAYSRFIQYIQSFIPYIQRLISWTTYHIYLYRSTKPDIDWLCGLYCTCFMMAMTSNMSATHPYLTWSSWRHLSSIILFKPGLSSTRHSHM